MLVLDVCRNAFQCTQDYVFPHIASNWDAYFCLLNGFKVAQNSFNQNMNKYEAFWKGCSRPRCFVFEVSYKAKHCLGKNTSAALKENGVFPSSVSD